LQDTFPLPFPGTIYICCCNTYHNTLRSFARTVMMYGGPYPYPYPYPYAYTSTPTASLR